MKLISMKSKTITMKNIIFLAFSLIMMGLKGMTQDINSLVQKVRTKLETVRDYQASGTMKTNVSFLKVPVSNISMYYKKPDKIRIKSEKGVSFIPKGAMNISMSDIFNKGTFMIIDAGADNISGIKVRVAKMLPADENSDLVLSTLYIDPQNSVVLKCKTTTRDNGSYELMMTYGKYIAYGLPDKIDFTFNTKDYKLPKGITFDFDDGQSSGSAPKQKTNKGSAVITISSYQINKGLRDDVFR